MKKFIKQILNFLPHNRLGNKIFYLAYYIYSQKKLPGGKKSLSSYFYELKSSQRGFDPLLSFISDKELVKHYIGSKIGSKYCVPTIKVFNSYDEFESFQLPKSCCIKPTHLSGQVVFLTSDSEKIDQKKIKGWFKENYYYLSREKNYKFLTPKVIVEELVFNKKDNEDLKFFCYKGRVKFIQIDLGRWSNHTRIYFNRNWEKLSFSISKQISDTEYPKPKNYEKLLELAEEISKDFEFIRVDFYTDNEQIFIGELTNLPEAGNGNFVPPESEADAYDTFFGSQA